MHSPSAPPSAASIARHYDTLDPFYRDLWGEQVHHGLWTRGDETPEEAISALTGLAIQALALPEGARVADVGCGYGAVARRMAEERGARVVGYTLSSAQKAYSDRQPVGRGSVEVRVLDWSEAAWEPESFDGILALESLEHIADKAGLAQAAWRALRPGGRLVVMTWLQAESLTKSRRRLMEAIARESRIPPFATLGGLKERLEQAGFAEVRAEDLHGRVRRTWGVILRRLVLRTFTRPAYLRFLLNSRAEDRIFAVTAIRIWLAYRRGCMRYGFFVATR